MGVFRKKTISKGTEGGLKYICDVCSKDITATVRIRCSVCSEYDLCVTCFSKGACSQTHVPSKHAFQVIEQHSIPIYEETWGADEELCLLEGAEAYGLGSWADIADHIGGFRTKDEVRDHYVQTYVYTPHFPLPAKADPSDTQISQRVPREEFQARKKRRIDDCKEAQRSQPPAVPKTKPTASQPSCHEVAGYMPGRLEFETEFANEAEEAVQSMYFEPGDGIDPYTGAIEPEMELKMTIMDIYNSRLTARADRKKAIFEHDLLEYRKNVGIEKRRTKEEKTMFDKVKPFVRLMSHKDFKDFSERILEEQNLRQAISQLQEWRHMKIQTLKDGEQYEQAKATRLARPLGVGVFDRPNGVRSDRKGDSRLPSDAFADFIAPHLPGHLKPRPPEIPISASKSHERNQSAQAQAQPGPGRPEAPKKPRYTTPHLNSTDRLEFSHIAATDSHLLTGSELELCSILAIMPKPYLVIKEAIIKEALKNGGNLKRRAIKELCKIDPAKCSRIYDFFIHSGWIQKA